MLSLHGELLLSCLTRLRHLLCLGLLSPFLFFFFAKFVFRPSLSSVNVGYMSTSRYCLIRYRLWAFTLVKVVGVIFVISSLT